MAPIPKNAVEDFREKGFLRVERAFDLETNSACLASIEEELRAHSIDLRDPETWTKPVIRFSCPEGPAFATAGMSPRLCSLYDALLGTGNWTKRQGVGGTLPIRFPSEADPGDAGWHIDGSYEVDGRYFVNLHSRRRALLALFLFTDVTELDAPTEILVGSQRDIPPLLQPHGDRGLFFGDVASRLSKASYDRPKAHAVGRAGDVYLCHPFLRSSRQLAAPRQFPQNHRAARSRPSRAVLLAARPSAFCGRGHDLGWLEAAQLSAHSGTLRLKQR